MKFLNKYYFPFAVLTLILFRLWILSAQDLTIVANAGHDDLLFIRLADSIINGHWLGQFTNTTLAKGPLLPLFIAMCFKLGIPLLLAQNILYSCACILMILAIRPLFSNRFILLLFFIYLLFQPSAYEADDMLRVSRSSINQSFCLLVIASAIGLFLSFEKKLNKELLWSISLGFSTSLFWLTREERIWIIPSLSIIWFAILTKNFFKQPKKLKRVGLTFVLYCVYFLGPVQYIKYLNNNYYQISNITEFDTREFKAAYAATTRVKDQRIQYIPVTKKTRNVLYENSPSFNTLKDAMEGYVAESWASNSTDLTGIESTQKEIAGGWWMWALRDAVKENGYYSSGVRAMQFYTDMADEINQACNEGKIECYRAKESMLPVLEKKDILHIAYKIPSSLFSYLRLPLSPFPYQSVGDNQQLQYFIRITKEQPHLLESEIQEKQELKNLKLKLLDTNSKVYSKVLPLAFDFSMAIYFLKVFQSVKKMRVDMNFIVLTSLLVGILSLTTIVVIIDHTSFHAIYNGYLAPVYLFCILFTSLGLLEVPNNYFWKKDSVRK